MGKTNRFWAGIIAFFYITVISGCTSLSITVSDFSREEKSDAKVSVSSNANAHAEIPDKKILSARHETPPIALDNLTYARLMYEQRQKVVIIETIISPPPENTVPTPNESNDTKQNDPKELIKPYLVKPRFDKRVMGIRHAYSGTGFVCGKDVDGEKILICTNAHVIRNGIEVIVRTATDKEYRAQVLAEDQERDIAVLAIQNQEKLSSVMWGDSDSAVIGESVMAIGHPRNYLYSASHGIISAKILLLINDDKSPLPFLQLDMMLNPGNSGSPVFNMAGEMVGVVARVLRDSQGIGFAIPANEFQKIIKDMKAQQAPVAPQ